MAKKEATKNFVLRVDAETMDALEKWAADEFRSINGQLQWIIAEALRKSGRQKKKRAKKEEEETPEKPKENIIQPRDAKTAPGSWARNPRGSLSVRNLYSFLLYFVLLLVR